MNDFVSAMSQARWLSTFRVARQGRARLVPWVALMAACVMSLQGNAVSAPGDAAARGLDMFVEMPPSAVAGGTLMLDVRTFGFATTVEPAPLGRVHLEAGFEGRDTAPVVAESADDGTAALTLAMPDDKADVASVVVAMSYGTHRRVRTFPVTRAPRYAIELHVEETQVAPGSRIPAWVFARDVQSGGPAKDIDVLVTLTEGGVVRASAPVRTDASGAAMTQIDIPDVEEPDFAWRLAASTTHVRSQDSSTELVPREDAPAQPTLTATFDAVRLPAATSTTARIRVTAATGEPLAKQAIDYVFSDDGPSDPTFERWEKEAKRASTDAAGTVVIPYQVPAIALSTAKKLSVRTEIDGRQYDASARLEVVARASPRVELTPEAGQLVPGVSQRVLVHARDGFDKPIAQADLKIEADGFSQTVTTDARGLAEIEWKVPIDVGASRKVGPCSGSVAATVRVSAVGHAPAELIAAGAVPKCVAVDRSARGVLRPQSLIVRSGEKVGMRVDYAAGKEPTGPMTASVSSSKSGVSLVWARTRTDELDVPVTAGGVFEIAAAVPTSKSKAADAHASVLVKPRILPKLTSRVTGGRLAPGGDAVVEAKLVDESGAPLQGSVMGIVFDKLARPDEGVPPALDTRLELCSSVGIEASDCDALLAGDPALMPLLRGSLPHTEWQGMHVAWDPGASAREEMRTTFNTVLKNLEGALMESSMSVESLRDVMRKGRGQNEFNPEILTLVTAVLAAPPTTPGGEPFSLEDLRAVDGQVTYDTVARRVTRLKMFRVLQAVRVLRNTQDLDANEPTFQDPNALLRRLLEKDEASSGGSDDDAGGDVGVDPSALLDPWGTPMQFVKSSGPQVPFINVVPGWELHAAGPDGKIGSADDIKDPFARMVKSGSPYARAMGEDKLVDSRLDMRVGDETVAKWSAAFEEFTGSQLSTGEGFGSGNGRLGGSHRTRAPSVRMGATSVTRDSSAYILGAPVRTNKDGVAILTMPLGGDETTYRILLVALPDGAGHAASAVDVSTSLPLSARVFAGTHWTHGDAPEVRVKLTNRTAQPVHGKLHVAADGAAELSKGEPAERVVDVPAGTSIDVRVKVTARSEGEARIVAALDGGTLKDSVEHRLKVGPRGRRMTLVRSRWVDRDVAIDAFANDAETTLEGKPSLEIEATFDDTLASAMNALRADKLGSVDAATDAIEVFERLRRTWEKADPPLASKAERMREQATGRYTALLGRSENADFDHAATRRARFWMKANETDTRAAALPAVEACPSEKASSSSRLREIEGEPSATGGAIASCWDAAATGAMQDARSSGDPVVLARLVLAFSERSHRNGLAVELARELAKLVSLTPSGEIAMSSAFANDRAAKTIVYAALVRATALGYRPVAEVDTLIGWLLVQRAPDGGFGSAAATRAAVAALVDLGPRAGARTVRLTERDASGDTLGEVREVSVGRSTRVALDARTRRVSLEVVGAPAATEKAKVAGRGVLVRLEQKALRAFSTRPGARDLENPLSMEVKWPRDASVGAPASVEVRFSYKSEGETALVARIPLPPGATLAEAVTGVRLVNGALLVNTTVRDVGPNVPMLVPIRFAMSGSFTIPEGAVRASADDGVRARTMSERLLVRAGAAMK